MKYEQFGDLAFAGLSLLPFPIFLSGYAELAGLVFVLLLGAIGVLGWIGQSRKRPEVRNRRSP